MRRIFLYFIALLYSSFTCLYSQVLKGRILDGKTLEGLEYANVSVAGKNYGTSADSKGRYLLDVSKNLSDTLLFSYIGYKDFLVPVSLLVKEKNDFNVFLYQEEFHLGEVVISADKTAKYKSEAVFRLNKNATFTSSRPFGSEVAVLVKSNNLSSGKLRGITIYTRKVDEKLYKSYNSSFKINFYSLGADGMPGEELYSKSIVLKDNLKNKLFLDLSDYNIFFDKGAFFVGIEIFNSDDTKPKYGEMYCVNPTLLMTHTKECVSCTRYRCGVWNRDCRYSVFKKGFYTAPLIKVEFINFLQEK